MAGAWRILCDIRPKLGDLDICRNCSSHQIKHRRPIKTPLNPLGESLRKADLFTQLILPYLGILCQWSQVLEFLLLSFVGSNRRPLLRKFDKVVTGKTDCDDDQAEEG